MTLTTKDFGALAGVAEPEAAVDPNAPVEQPRRCGLCAHFARIGDQLPSVPSATASQRSRRFGVCRRWELPTGSPGINLHDAPFDLGPGLVGDLFGCVFFAARRP